MRSNLLEIVAVYSNPRRFQSRIRLAKEFIARTLDSGANLTFVECAFGERQFEFSGISPHVNLIQVRSSEEIWLKEALANIGFRSLKDWKYGALIDSDIEFNDPNFASETVHMLQHYSVGQPWTDSLDLGPKGQVVPNEWGNYVDRSFAAAYQAGDVKDDSGNYYAPFSNPSGDNRQHYGYAWAFRREAFDGFNGLIDWIPTGAADYHMAMSFVGMGKYDPGKSRGWNRRLSLFRSLCDDSVRSNVGCIPGLIKHHWHGRKANRFYISKDQILTASKFDPDIDLGWKDGLPFIQTDNRILRDGLKRFNLAVDSDSVDI